MASPKFSE